MAEANIYSQLLDQDDAQTQAQARIPAGDPTPAPDTSLANTYTKILDQDDAQTQALVNTALGLAGRIEPDAAARAKALARSLNLPVDTVERNLPQAEVLQRGRDIVRLRDASPVLWRQLTDPEFAKIAHDDTATLSGVEKTLRALGAAGRYVVGSPGDGGNSLAGDVVAGLYRANRGAAGMWQAAADVPAALLDPLIGTKYDPFRYVADYFAAAGAQSEANARWYSPPQADTIASGISSGVQSIVQSTIAMPLALLPGGQGAALSIMAGTQGGQSYQEAREKGISPVRALPFAVSQGAIEYATEKIPLHRLAGDIAKDTPLFKMLLRQIGSEVPGEQVATVLQDLNDWAVLHPDKPFADYLAERPSAATQTLIATLVGVGGNVTVMKGIDRVMTGAEARAQRAQVAQQQADALVSLTTAAQASKVLQRDPETFQRFVASAAEDGPVQQVFIDANTLMQSGVAEQVAALSPAVAAQLPEAAQTGGQIAIPVEEYATRIAPTEYAQDLLNHLKTDPEGFSRAEAEVYMQGQAEELKAEMERVLSEQEGDVSFRQSADAVRTSIKDQLDTAGRFTPQVNDAYSSLVGSFYAVQAARLGIMPEELAQRLPLKVVAELSEGEGFGQSDSAGGVKLSRDKKSVEINLHPFGASDLPSVKDLKQRIGTEEGKAQTAQLRDRMWAFYRKHIAGQSETVPGLGTVTFDGGRKIKATSADPLKLALVEKLPDLLRTGTYNGPIAHDPHNAHAERQAGYVKSWHRVDNVVMIDGEEHHVMMIIREDTSGKFHYNINFAEKRSYRTPSSGPDNKSGVDLSDDKTLGQSITPNDDGINLHILEQRARGLYVPGTQTIALLKSADLSTFLHESGHFFLDAMERLAADPVSPNGIRDDMDAALRWIGVAGETPDARLVAWRGMSLEEKRPGHEKWARGFEAYLFEGKAPSIELHGLFQRFRAWMLNVYRDLKALDVKLTPEVRGVFDRMLATGDQIALAEQGRSMMPLFASAEQAGMSAEEFAAYQALGVDATNEAIEDLQARGLRDMQWMHNACGRVIKQLQKEAAARRADVRKQVADEVNAQPIYRADRFLRYGELEIPSGASQTVRRAAEQANLEGTKLSLPALKEMYGEAENAIWRYLPTGKHGLAATEGLHPDTVADIFGFTSGDELVRKLLAVAPRNEEIEALTDVRMLEQHGELSTPEAIERAADAAIHNDARARFVATEANALARAAAGPAEQTGVDRRGRPVVRRILPKAAKEYAQAMIDRLKVRDIRPGQYAAAEARAAKASERAMKTGDLATAAAEKRNQLIQNQAARAAYNAQDEVERGLRYLRKFERGPKNLDADYADQINNLLERFNLRSGQSNKAVDKRTALADWLKSQREAGFEPNIPADLENEAFRMSYKNMTVEEFRGLVDTVRQIEHLGKLKHKLLTAADQRAYEAARDEIANSIHDNAGDRAADTRTPTTNAGRSVHGLKQFWAAHIKAAMWARVLDGGKDGGPMWEYFVRTANERGDKETTMRADATARLSEILAPVFALGKMGGRGQYFPSVGRSLNREARLAIALNTGNEGNLQRLLDGEGWTVEQIAPVLRSLTAAEWHAVQSVWDHFDSYRPQIAAKERRVYGAEPEWVEPAPFTVQTADGQAVDLRGGYYPIKYDPAASQRAEEHADAGDAKRQMQGAYTSATTRRSFTKSRVEEVRGRPLLYTLSGLYSGVNDVIHDLAWHEWLIDANRLLRSQTIDKAIREHYGPEVKQQFKTWVQDVAEGDKGAANAAELSLGRLRQGVSIAGLGFNVMSAFMQPLGITQSIVRVGATWVGRGVQKYVANPVALTRQVNGMSDFMANRARTRFRELNELRNQVQDQSALKDKTGRWAYFLMMRFQQTVDVPTWWGAYEKALAEGNDDKRAIALADQAVIDAQGGGQTKDLSAIERGGPALKLFTVFYSFMNTALNLGAAQTMTANTTAKRARLAVDYALLYVVPAILGVALKDALTPGDSGDWDDPEKLAKKLIAAQIDYLMGLMFLVREFSDAAKAVAGLDAYGYSGPAGVRLIPDLTKFAQQASQAEFDDAFRKAFVNVMGDLLGLPAAQANRTISGTKALAEGKTNNPAAVVFGFQEKR